MAKLTLGGLSHDEFLSALPAMPKIAGRTHFAHELEVWLDDPVTLGEPPDTHRPQEPSPK